LLEIYHKIQEKYIGINQNILTKQKAQLRKFWRTKGTNQKKLPASAINRHNSKNATERMSSGVERLVGTDRGYLHRLEHDALSLVEVETE